MKEKIILGVPRKAPNVWFDASWKRLFLQYLLLYFLNQLESWYKAIQNRLKVLRAIANQSLNFRTRWWQPTRFFRKCSHLKQPYCFIKVHWSVKISWIWKRRNCFNYLSSKKAFCTRYKTKRGTGYHLLTIYQVNIKINFLVERTRKFFLARQIFLRICFSNQENISQLVLRHLQWASWVLPGFHGSFQNK